MTNFNKICTICGKEFITRYKNKNICSFSCRQESNKKAALRSIKRKKDNLKGKCLVCGWSLTTDIHHEGKKTYRLCPNHHALITRNIKTIKELLNVDF